MMVVEGCIEYIYRVYRYTTYMRIRRLGRNAITRTLVLLLYTELDVRPLQSTTI